ncbi:MAG TPA: hypothetical protein VF210_04775 [Pseudomonadales bacterium]
MATTVADEGRVRPIEQRLTDERRLPPLGLWIVVTLLVIVVCTAWHNVTGAWRGIEVGGELFWRTPWRLEIVFAVIFGYILACGGWVVRGVRRDLEALAPALAIGPSELAEERARIGAFPASTLFIATAAGFAVGIAIHALVNAMLPSGHSALEDLLWRAIRDVAIWVFSMRLILVVIGSSWRVSQIVERTARIDLFDLRGLAPIVRIGLRNALAFAAGVSMLAAMSGDEVTLPVTLATMAIVGAVGAFALLLPVRGARRAIRTAKNAELLAVRAAIRRTRTATLEGSPEGEREAMLLSGLLALEARLAGVVEWPFDLGTFVRLFFFLTLPLASWVAAAVVERFVSYLLG